MKAANTSRSEYGSPAGTSGTGSPSIAARTRGTSATADVQHVPRHSHTNFDEFEQPLDPTVHARRWITLATLCMSLLIIVMDNTILNVAIPSLMSELGATNSDIQWILDSYILVFAGLLLTTGTMSDRFGRKGALQLGIVWFALGSTAAALSTSATQLIFARAFMGVGGALIMPATLSILTDVFRDPKERAQAIAFWAGFSSLGVAIGPITGGLLLEHFSWSSVFWVNLPIGAVALIAGFFFVPKSRDTSQTKLDPVGAILSVIGLVTLVYGIIEGPHLGWTNPQVLSAFGVGLVVMVSFVLWELRSPHPMLPMTFFKNPRFSAANAAITMTFFALLGSLFLMTQYWQFVQGYSPLEAGIRVVPHAATMAIVAPMSARVVNVFGTKRVVSGGLFIVAAAMIGLSFVTAHASYWEVIILFCLISVGLALTMAPATESIMGSLPRSRAGIGSALNDMTRQVGGALGVAIIGSVVAAVYTNDIAALRGRFSLSGAQTANAEESLGNALEVANDLGANGAAFTEAARDSFVGAFHTGLRFSAVIIVLAALVTWRFLPARSPNPDDDIVDEPEPVPTDPVQGLGGAIGGS